MRTRATIIFLGIIICACACQEAGNKKVTPHNSGAATAKKDSPKVIRQNELLHAKGQYCIIKNVRVEEGVTYIDADYIQFFTGDEAVKEAKKRGDAEKTVNAKGDTVYSVLDDVYIVNDNKMVRRLPLAGNVEISLLHTENGKPAWIKGNIGQLKERLSDDAIFILTLGNDAVTQIRQQYLP